MIRRGSVCWANLADPVGSAPGFRRPVLVIQSDDYNASTISTVVVVVITSTLRLAQYPDNVFVAADLSGLDRDSVVNMTQVLTVDRRQLTEPVGALPEAILDDVDVGLRRVLGI